MNFIAKIKFFIKKIQYRNVYYVNADGIELDQEDFPKFYPESILNLRLATKYQTSNPFIRLDKKSTRCLDLMKLNLHKTKFSIADEAARKLLK